MKKKSLLVLSVLLLSQTTVFSMDGGNGDGAGFDMSRLQNIFVGGCAGYVAGWGLDMVGVERIMHLPVVRHIFEVADPEQRKILETHLPELGALIGAVMAQGGLPAVANITKVGAIIDLITRLRSGELTVENAVYMLRDLLWACEGFAPNSIRDQVPYLRRVAG